MSMEDEPAEDVDAVEEAGPEVGKGRLRVCERIRERKGGIAESVAV